MLKEVAEKRLHAIREYSDLGSGFKIAMRDMEIRGVGTLLGQRQHGHMQAVGYNLYCKMLNEAVLRLKGNKAVDEDDFETVADIQIDAFIPDSYIKNEALKLDIYRRIAAIEGEEEKDDMLEELIDRFGEPRTAVMNLLAITLLRGRGHSLYIKEVQTRPDRVTRPCMKSKDPCGTDSRAFGTYGRQHDLPQNRPAPVCLPVKRRQTEIFRFPVGNHW